MDTITELRIRLLIGLIDLENQVAARETSRGDWTYDHARMVQDYANEITKLIEWTKDRDRVTFAGTTKLEKT